MSDGNKRYLGDVLINEENYERQKQFFRDIIESYQYKYGGNFDAATLQGRSASEFATKEQGERADRAILSPLFLGKSEITNIEDSQYILTDAVKLDREIVELRNIEWFAELEDDNLTEALIAIYNEVAKKVDVTVYNDFIDNDYTPFKNSLLEAFETTLDDEGNEILALNASLVNGLRICLTTQERYDQLPTEVQNYWRNIFIFRDASEIPPEYEDPLAIQLTDGYEFRINDGMLEFTNGLSDTWREICSLEELLIGMGLYDLIDEYLSGDEGSFTINEENLLESLAQISPTSINENWENYPFLSSSLHDDFVEQITINDSDDYVNTSVDPITKFKNVDIDIDSILNNTLSPISQELENTQNDLLSLSQNISQNISDINNTDNEQNSVIQNLQSTLTSINNKITTINNNISSIGSWTQENISGLKYNDGTTTHQSFIIYNTKLGIAHVWLFFGMFITPNDLGNAVTIRTNKTTTKNFVVSKHPKGSTGFQISGANPQDMVKIDVGGKIWFRTTRTSAPNALIPVYTNFFYKF